MVPDDRSRAETDGQPTFSQPPADVHVVSGRMESFVEAADLLERLPAKRHVAAGDVLRLPVGDEYVGRAAGRIGDAAGDHSIIREGQVGPSHARVVRAHERVGEILQPFGVRFRVVVDVGDDLARGDAEPGVAGG